jgi:hypothetical protein
MQREKLYNPQNKVDFGCVIFALKKARFCATTFRRRQKIILSLSFHLSIS